MDTADTFGCVPYFRKDKFRNVGYPIIKNIYDSTLYLSAGSSDIEGYP